MLVKEIVNHTPYTIGFTYDDNRTVLKTIMIASRGVFNANHNYDRVADDGVLRIVDDPTIVELAMSLCIPNFILLKDLLTMPANMAALKNITFFVMSGLGKSSSDMYMCAEPDDFKPETNRMRFVTTELSTALDSASDLYLTVPESYFINAPSARGMSGVCNVLDDFAYVWKDPEIE